MMVNVEPKVAGRREKQTVNDTQESDIRFLKMAGAISRDRTCHFLQSHLRFFRRVGYSGDKSLFLGWQWQRQVMQICTETAAQAVQ